MKLITPPAKNTDYLRATDTSAKFYDCQILCPDADNEADEMWFKLKYGTVLDLWLHQTVAEIDFPEDRIILYGVKPIAMERSAIWDGRVFDCKIDSFVQY